MDWYMQQFDPAGMLMGTLCSLLAVGFLYFAWRRPQREPVLLLVGWGLAGIGLWFWVDAAGFDAGAALAIVWLMLAGLILVLLNGDWPGSGSMATGEARKTTPSTPSAPSLPIRPDTSGARRHLATGLRVIAAGPLGFAASLMLALCITTSTAWAAADKIVGTGLVALLLWSLLMVWSCATQRLLTHSAILAGTTGIAGLVLGLLV